MRSNGLKGKVKVGMSRVLWSFLLTAAFTCSVFASAPLPELVGDGVHDDTDAIQARLDTKKACVYLPPPAKCYLISRTLEIHSDQELRLDRYSVIRLAAKSDCRMLVNRNWKTGDKRVAVTGGIWDFNNLGQSPNPHMTKFCNPPYVAYIPKQYTRDFFHGEAFTFDRVEGLEIRGVTIRNPTTYGLQLTRVSYFVVDDITLDYTTWNPSPLNLDGVHLDGGCHHGRISNIRGTAYDDMVALNANDWICSAYEGPIHDIDIDGIYAEYSHSAVRLLSAGAPVSRVNIRNVHGNFYVYAIGLTHHFKEKPRGRFDDIVIENVFISKAKTPEGIGSRAAYPLIWVDTSVDAGSVTIKGYHRDESTIGIPSICVSEGSHVERLTVRDANMVNRLEKPISFISGKERVDTLVTENIRLIPSDKGWK